MTGYGRADVLLAGDAFRVEVRSVNHKGLDIRVRMPRELLAHESAIMATVRNKVVRGHVDVYVSVEGGGARAADISINEERVKALGSAWQDLAEMNGGPSSPSTEWLAAQEGVLELLSRDLSHEDVRGALTQATSDALTDLVQMREQEGATLATDLTDRLNQLAALTTKMEEKAPLAIAEARERMRQRITELSEERPGDSGRIEQELVLWSERADVSEEIVRLGSHIAQLEAILRGGVEEGVGKKVAFLGQELMREATTVGSKAATDEMSMLSVDARCIIEQIREQTMNIE